MHVDFGGLGLRVLSLRVRMDRQISAESSVQETWMNHATSLNISENKLACLPRAFASSLLALRFLDLSANLLAEFPSLLCQMPTIETLDVSRNFIHLLPDSLGVLSGSLKSFSVSENKITFIPSCFGHATTLQILKIEGNPIQWPPQEIINSIKPDGSSLDAVKLFLTSNSTVISPLVSKAATATFVETVEILFERQLMKEKSSCTDAIKSLLQASVTLHAIVTRINGSLRRILANGGSSSNNNFKRGSENLSLGVTEALRRSEATAEALEACVGLLAQDMLEIDPVSDNITTADDGIPRDTNSVDQSNLEWCAAGGRQNRIRQTVVDLASCLRDLVSALAEPTQPKISETLSSVSGANAMLKSAGSKVVLASNSNEIGVASQHDLHNNTIHAGIGIFNISESVLLLDFRIRRALLVDLYAVQIELFDAIKKLGEDRMAQSFPATTKTANSENVANDRESEWKFKKRKETLQIAEGVVNGTRETLEGLKITSEFNGNNTDLTGIRLKIEQALEKFLKAKSWIEGASSSDFYLFQSFGEEVISFVQAIADVALIIRNWSDTGYSFEKFKQSLKKTASAGKNLAELMIQNE
ncbi:Leucine-rich repeat serine/threonine-protein kinase 2 [Physocladia obscura]|uniref:Leucine-rich repeat serine/threonine-protein kinase 2 n=1 Tax=Physocladia obscura TaxID=109957 RepID=A0AAD5XHA0_9FUNG|nr:Leucine-rich repeat serine/threonine-protein kinase 2 [Physocladia obscura]